MLAKGEHMRWLTTVGLALATATAVPAQNMVSAKAGLVHYAEGDVLVAGNPVEQKMSVFTTMKPGEHITTTEGRAEVLLGPGVVLRVSENSIVKLINNEVTDTRLELLAGQIILEAADTVKDNKTTILAQGRVISPKKDGLFSVEAGPAPYLRVWNGEVDVTEDGKTQVIKGGRELALYGEGKIEKFEKDDTDPLYRWAKRRSGYLAVASVSGARNADRWIDSFGASRWMWNPYMNMFTFIPMRGVWMSPFGWSFYSPGAVWALYTPRWGGWGGGGSAMNPTGPRFDPNLGYNTIPMRSPTRVGGYGGGSVGGGGGAVAAPSAPAAPSRGGGSMGPAVGAGGRRGN
jgi:hypothetical protein